MVRCWLPGLDVRERMLLVRLRSCKVQPGKRTNHGESEREGAKQCDLESLWEKTGISISHNYHYRCAKHIQEPSMERFVQGFCVAQARSTLQYVHDSTRLWAQSSLCV
jgi:hypothetical protein